MNWLDIVIIVVLIAAVIQGLRVGLLGAAVTAIGGLIGWLLAGQFGPKVGAVISSSANADRIVTVIAYAIIIILVIIATRFVWKFISPVLNVVMLGTPAMVDKLGGIVLGLIMGIVVSGAIILLLARFTYNFDPPTDKLPDQISDRLPPIQDTREGIESALIESKFVPTFVRIANALPGDGLGFVPSDFNVAIGHLANAMEGL